MCTFDDIVDLTVYTVDPRRPCQSIQGACRVFGEPPYPTLTGYWRYVVYCFNFELKVIAKLPEDAA